MLNYYKCIFLLPILNTVWCRIEHLNSTEWEKQFDNYEKSLREQMRPNSMADTILLINKLDKAVESDVKDWDWKLRATNKTLSSMEEPAAAEEDAASALLIMEKYGLGQLRNTTIRPDKLKDLGHKIKNQRKIYRKSFKKFEIPVLRFQARQHQRQKLREKIIKKLFGKSGSSTIQISVVQLLFYTVPLIILTEL